MSKENDEFLPTEIIVGILSKLPTMSVLRFYCVSKQWLNILSDEHFRSLHSEVLLHLRPYPKIIFSTEQKRQQQQRSIITFSSPCSTSHHTIKNVSHGDGHSGEYEWLPEMHCNGLLCMIGCISGLKEGPMIVCNPLTLEYFTLPRSTSTATTPTTWVYVTCAGLGFAPLSKQFKACIYFVKLYNEPPNFPVLEIVMEVYTLGDTTTTWRVVESNVDFEPLKDGLYADGKIYRLIWGPHPTKHRLLSFDVESERSTVLGSLPNDHLTGYTHLQLVQLGSRVSLLMQHYDFLIEVWMLEENCSNAEHNYCDWYIRQRIKLPNQLVDEGEHFKPWLLHVLEYGDEDLLFVLQGIILRRFSDGRISYIKGECGSSSRSSVWSPCCGYKPSLVSLKKYGCVVGEVVVDDGLESPPSIQIPPPPSTWLVKLCNYLSSFFPPLNRHI